MADGQAEQSAPTGEAAIIAAIDAQLATPKEEEKAVPAVEGEDAPDTEAASEEADAAASEGEEAETEKSVAEIPLEQLEAIELETKVQGVIEKHTIKELREGYMRQKDYSQKTAEVARQREEVGETVRKAVESQRTQMQQDLQQIQNILIETISPELKDVNWNHLATNEPAEYVRLRNRADQIANVLSTVKAKQTELTQQQQNEQRQAMQRVAQESRSRLEAEIPGWNDNLYQELMKVGVEVGYKQDEVANWLDPRAFKVLHEVYEYRKLKAGKPPTSSKVVTPPRVVKPGATAANSQKQQRHSEAMKRLQSSGNVQDAAAVIRARLGL